MTDSRRQAPATRGWLVRVDPEIHADPKIGKLGWGTRYAYIDSLFHLASTVGPDGVYPIARLRAEFDNDEPKVARLVAGLVRISAWEPIPFGFHVLPYAGCRVVPERRIAIPADLRWAIYERDGHRCVQCGSRSHLSLDHIFPWSLGGPDTYENLRTLCRPCNSRKGAKV